MGKKKHLATYRLIASNGLRYTDEKQQQQKKNRNTIIIVLFYFNLPAKYIR